MVMDGCNKEYIGVQRGDPIVWQIGILSQFSAVAIMQKIQRFIDFRIFQSPFSFLLSVLNKLILYITSILRQLSTMLSNANYADDKNLLAHPNRGFRCYLHLSMVV